MRLPEKKERLPEKGLEEMEVFGKDERANADEYEAAEDFGAFADGAAQEAAQAQKIGRAHV